MNPFGLVLIAALMLAPLIWLPGIGAGRDTTALASQYIGLLALIAMALGQVIATRWRGVEAVFGPLDQSYRIHKWLGIGAMVAVLVHDTIDAEMRGLGAETALAEVAETAGEISLYGLLIFVVITIATFVPYHLWKWTHRLIGVFFVLGAFHYLFILKPFSNGDPLGLYMAAVCAVGLVAYVWTSAPRGLRPSFGYCVTGLTDAGGALVVDMAPDGRSLRHRAGQFAFFRFAGAGMNEPHPFTISSAPGDDGALRVSVAPLGDYTRRVRRALAVGQAVRVDGPYGHFGRARGRQVWVGAGVGITPFAALAGALGDGDGPVTLIYTVKNAGNAAHLDELNALAAAKPNLTLVVWESDQKGRLDADRIAELAGDLKGVKVLFCGPAPMRRKLGHDLSKHGVRRRNFHYEAFEIRTGLGLRRLLGRL